MLSDSSTAVRRQCFLVIMLCAPAVTLAQEAAENTLDEIVVTATRLETTVRDAARSVSVIDQEHIQNGRQQLALDEALAGIPGLYLQNRYNFAQDLRVALRGFGARSSFGFRGVKVIVDGIPETLPDGQAGVDSIDLGSARRIEVLRGPSSSMYGNASGGVIAIESEFGSGSPFVEANLAAGELGYEKYQLKSGGESGKFNYLVNISSQEMDGYRDHSRSEGTLLNSRFGVALTENDSLMVAFNLTDQPVADDPGGVNEAQAAEDPSSARDRNVLFDAGEALDQQRVGLIYKRDRSSGTLTVRNYYVWRDFSNKLPFQGGGSVDLDRFFYGFGAQFAFGDILPENVELSMGFDIDRQDDDRKRFDNNMGDLGPLVFDQQEKVDGDGIYVQGRYAINAAWALSAGLRYDEITFDVTDNFLANGDDSGKATFDQFSPSAGITYDFGGGVLFGNFSSSFETPTTTELANPDGSGGFNQELDAQTAQSFELGYKAGNENLFFELAVFHINLEDELVPFEVDSSPGRTFFMNAGKSSRTGVETAVAWSNASGFGVDASLTWSDFTFDEFVDDNGNDFSGSRLPGLPEYFGYLAFHYETEGGFTAALESSYSGSLFANNANTAKVSSYVVTGLRAAYEFRNGDWLFRPYVGINNLFDESYNSNIRINAFGARYFEPAPERNIYAGIVIRFQ